MRVVPRAASTNTELLAAPSPGPQRMAVLAAEEQTAGRGRRGRHWLSAGEASLAFSVRRDFAAPPPSPAGLSLAAGVAVVQALEGLGERGVLLKWPNDLLHRGAKLGGILVEMTQVAGRGPAVVIGIGLNLRALPETPADTPLPVGSLDRALNPLPSRNAVLAAILGALSAMLPRFAVAGFAPFRDDWQARNAWAGREVRVVQEGARELEGLCLGVDDDGALLLGTAAGTRRVLCGDVSLRVGAGLPAIAAADSAGEPAPATPP
ncbi:MAG: biotin--[acetyl-CoA-carboxylase] ligase [Betaproteobacteria bacterium]|nr:biotin--[acetyl-CoA-carboxylase] ligase [Betaproteobacteria bacterium]